MKSVVERKWRLSQEAIGTAACQHHQKANSTADLVGLIAELEQRKINFESLTEKIETSSPAGRLVFHVFAALAEFERNLIRERTVAGLKAARARAITDAPLS